MSQPPISSSDRAISPSALHIISSVFSELSSISSTDYGDTGSVFKAPQGSKSQNISSQALISRPKRN
jgi:hypothetical protein